MITDLMPLQVWIPRSVSSKVNYCNNLVDPRWEDVYFDRTQRGGYKCRLCATVFFISAWDLDGLRHGCTDAVK